MPREATRRETLTKRVIEQLEPQEDRYRVADVKSIGLAIVVQPTGRKTWELYRSVAGRPTRITLGQFPALTCEQARALAQEHGVAMARGNDPNAQKRARRQEPTLADLFSAYLEHHAKPNKATAEADEATYRLFLEPWAARRLSSITTAEVEQLRNKIGAGTKSRKNKSHGGRARANRVLALLSTMYTRGGKHVGYGGPNPCTGVSKFKEKSRERFLQADELPRFMASVDAEPEPWRSIFKLLLLTGARRGNVLGMRWNEVNLDARSWTMPTTKNGDPLTIPLVPQAVELLEERLEATGGGEFVFPGFSGEGHIQEARPAWKRICNRAGVGDLRIHDLRRSTGSWMAACGASLPQIGRLLGHREPRSTQIYARLGTQAVEGVLTQATDRMLKIAAAVNETGGASAGKPTTKAGGRRAK